MYFNFLRTGFSFKADELLFFYVFARGMKASSKAVLDGQVVIRVPQAPDYNQRATPGTRQEWKNVYGVTPTIHLG